MNKQDYSEWSLSQLQARLAELVGEIQLTDQQGLPVDEMMIECNRLMAMQDLLMEQFRGQAVYHAYWRSRQIKDEPPELPPEERVESERIDVRQRTERLEQLIFRRKHLKEHAAQVGDETLLSRQLGDLGLAAGEPDAHFNELWEQHEFAWQAHTAELRRFIMRQCAHIMLAFEDIERVEPHKFANDPKMLHMLHWWRDEGGREAYLGQITLEERRKLEKMAQQWRKENP